MASIPGPNFEEAATVAAEFITSLDNLPKEVEHLLQEIRIKEQKCQELLQDTAKDQARYIKSTLKTMPASIGLPSGANGKKSTSPTPAPIGLSSKAHLPGRIVSAYAEVETLNEEKIALAHRLINLLSLTRARLDSDLVKVRTLQGEPLEEIQASSLAVANQAQLIVSAPIPAKRLETPISGISTVAQINESLRNATTGLQIDPSSSAGYKKRRLTTNTSIKLPSPAPSIVPQSSTSTVSRSRLSRLARMQMDEEEVEPEPDAEGDEEFEGEDAEEDSTLYCFCHKQSYGDMIGCDNPDCSYQWFHLTCVGVKQPLPDKWYCPECSKNRSDKRKGRKK
ncbi:hypothetical protein CPB83DRAFT_842582 [Crepidotus variabilis]|uniref:Chromatin modification-related protein n=1 Tax=Crepidotus variabilis TaxID=179855 RepID=A0A9P6ETJ5_9AGAR|nr:hypothetical protein CPB83DRAFT_842582 [Crepidotus variabilis]